MKHVEATYEGGAYFLNFENVPWPLALTYLEVQKMCGQNFYFAFKLIL